jgi:hypothetical protein
MVFENNCNLYFSYKIVQKLKLKKIVEINYIITFIAFKLLVNDPIIKYIINLLFF